MTAGKIKSQSRRLGLKVLRAEYKDQMGFKVQGIIMLQKDISEVFETRLVKQDSGITVMFTLLS